MAWMQVLSEMYDDCINEAGKIHDNQPMLLPVSHITVNAQIEVDIDENGGFLDARDVDKSDAVTVIPVTEDSGSRSSGIAPHPLCDKLCYVAGDYAAYVDEKMAGCYEAYIKGLFEWTASPYSHEKVELIYQYLKKGSLIKDLIVKGVIHKKEDDNFDENYKIAGISQADAFVRFRVIKRNSYDDVKETWRDKSLFDAYVKYSVSRLGNIDLCCVKGERMPCTVKHPQKIRNSGDKAKLISANDETDFTFKGRFTDKNEAVSVGYETSQKAHNMLRWLIAKQGYTSDTTAYVAWEIHNYDIPDIFKDSYRAYGIYDIAEDSDEDEEDDEPVVDVGERYAVKIRKCIAGYGKQLDDRAKVIIMGLDSATTGRMSIKYYRELTGSQFMENLNHWYGNCKWRFAGKNNGRVEIGEYTPAPGDIAKYAFGCERNGRMDISPKLLNATIERILPCIVDRRQIPKDIVRAAVNRAGRPESMSKGNWRRCVGIACALIKYELSYNNEEVKMEQDSKYDNDRDYLFGRLLALFEKIEECAYKETEDRTGNAESSSRDKRPTHASRYWNVYTRRPAKTACTIMGNLRPYINKLEKSGNSGLLAYYSKKIGEVMNLLNKCGDDGRELFNDTPLGERYLLGYYAQYYDNKKSNTDKPQEQ